MLIAPSVENYVTNYGEATFFPRLKHSAFDREKTACRIVSRAARASPALLAVFERGLRRKATPSKRARKSSGEEHGGRRGK